MKTCAYPPCSKPFIKGERRLYCTRKCEYRHKRGRELLRQCVVCARVIPETRPINSQFCSVECKKRRSADQLAAKRRTERELQPTIRAKCKCCGDRFDKLVSAPTVFCSDRCKREYAMLYHKAKYRAKKQKVIRADATPVRIQPPTPRAIRLQMDELIPVKWHPDFIAGATGNPDLPHGLTAKHCIAIGEILDRRDRVEIARVIMAGAQMSITYDEFDYKPLIQLLANQELAA